MKFWMALAYVPPEQALPLAQAADRAGYHGITVSDHLFEPQVRASKYPYTDDGAPPFKADTPWLDPWALISAMAAMTEQIQFTTNIYVAPLRDLFTVAKSVSTAAVLSGGRVAMGAAPGWCEEEFDQVGQAFKARGARLDEMIDVLRELWAGGWVSHDGKHIRSFEPLRIDPVPPAPIPIYIGGHSEHALRRAAVRGDGWIGNAYFPDEAEHHVGAMRDALKAADRLDDPNFEIIIALKDFPSDELHDRFAKLGVTGLLCAPWMFKKTLPERLEEVANYASFMK
jgi:probable F420-dependent oxidoreductase